MKVLWAIAVFATISANAVDLSYLPLSAGSRWELVSPADKKPMIFEVTAERSGVYVTRWENPFIKGVEYGFRPQEQGISLASLNFGSGTVNLPEGTIYFDFSKSPGNQWTNALGTFTLAARDVTVTTPAKAYPGCLHFKYQTKEKSVTDYFLAPGIGFVQVGAGSAAYKLTAYTPGVAATSRSATATRTTTAATGTVRSVPGAGKGLVSVEVNVPAGGGAAEYTKWFQTAYDLGAIRHLQASPIWDQAETSAGRYNLQSVDSVFPQAKKYNLPVYLNFRVIDTNRIALPKYLASRTLDDPAVLSAFEKFVDAVASRSQGTVQWVSIGNEVDVFLLDHAGVIPAYARFVAAAANKVRQKFPGVGLTVNMTFPGLREWGGSLRPLGDLCDFVSFTYYPLNADFSLRDPSNVTTDIQSLIAAAGSRPLFLQEIGYSSAPLIGASEAKQAKFIENGFAALRANRANMIGAYFVWMFDLSDAVLKEQTGYYKMSGADRFKAYLGTLGMFDKSARPKAAWTAFEREVKAFPK